MLLTVNEGDRAVAHALLLVLEWPLPCSDVIRPLVRINTVTPCSVSALVAHYHRLSPVPPSLPPRDASYGQQHPRPHPPNLVPFVWRVLAILGLRLHVF